MIRDTPFLILPAQSAMPFNHQIRGVNLGGWMVLGERHSRKKKGGAGAKSIISLSFLLPIEEPWITPSLFYQFLGGNETTTAMDHYSFCEVLGPEEGNRQLRRHWETWVTQDIIKQLAGMSCVDRVKCRATQAIPHKHLTSPRIRNIVRDRV